MATSTVNNHHVTFDDSAVVLEKPYQNGFHAPHEEANESGDFDGANNDTGNDSDPELKAELEYAKENGLNMATVKQRLRKAKLSEAGAEPPKTINGVVTVPRSQKNQRKSRAGRGRGLPKKVVGGCGGKGVWGTANKLYEEPEFLDSDDPNYDSDIQANVKFQAISPEVGEPEVAEEIEAIVLEFYDNANIQDALDSIEELDLARNLRPFVVRLMITLALDHKLCHRELTSQLLAELIAKRVFTQTDVARAFDRLLNSDLPDLVIDCPTAAQVLGKFIVRAIADEALPANFLEVTDKDAVANSHATEALEQAEVLAQHKHRLDDIWGVGNGVRPVRYLTKKIKLLLEEFLSSGDQKEAIACLRQLEVPHFHHELVFQAGVIIIESMHSRPVRLLTDLLANMFESGVLTPETVRLGFERLFGALPDLSLDVPPAHALLEVWVDACRKQGFLPDSVARKMPQKGRKRFVSEGDGGKFKVTDVPHPLI